MADLLRRTLEKLGVRVIEGETVSLGDCQLSGLGDHWAGDDQRDLVRIRRAMKPERPRVILTHNPDTASLLSPAEASLLLAGHTHGGQIRLPWITPLILGRITQGGFERGFNQPSGQTVFVTPGTGRIGLPFRFRSPPVIDVLTL